MPTATLSRIGFEATESYDPPKMLMARYMFEHECSNVQARAVFHQLKIFLWVCAKYPGRRNAPSVIVDGMWEVFIPFTHEYCDFCKLLGGYIHHRPIRGSDSLAYQRTRQAIVAEFGHYDGNFWPDYGAGSCTGDME